MQDADEQEIHSDSESEDEDAKLLTPSVDEAIHRVILMAKRRDPKLLRTKKPLIPEIGV